MENNGYGVVYNRVMRDKNISIEDKAVYAYIMSFTGGGASDMCKTKIATHELGVSEYQFISSISRLSKYGYILID